MLLFIYCKAVSCKVPIHSPLQTSSAVDTISIVLNEGYVLPFEIIFLIFFLDYFYHFALSLSQEKDDPSHSGQVRQ